MTSHLFQLTWSANGRTEIVSFIIYEKCILWKLFLWFVSDKKGIFPHQTQSIKKMSTPGCLMDTHVVTINTLFVILTHLKNLGVLCKESYPPKCLPEVNTILKFKYKWLPVLQSFWGFPLVFRFPDVFFTLRAV